VDTLLRVYNALIIVQSDQSTKLLATPKIQTETK